MAQWQFITAAKFPLQWQTIPVFSLLTIWQKECRCWHEWKWNGTGRRCALNLSLWWVETKVEDQRNGGSQDRVDWMIWPGEGCMLECPPKASIQTRLTEVHQSLLWTFDSQSWIWSEKTLAYLVSRGCFFFYVFFFSSLSLSLLLKRMLFRSADQLCLRFAHTERQLKGQMWLEWPLGKV